MLKEQLDLQEHLIEPLANGGHGFETGIPCTDRTHFDHFHEMDHRYVPNALTHEHEGLTVE